MFRLFSMMWVISGTVLAGAAIMVVVSIPSLMDQGMKLIPIAGVGGFVVALPVGWLLARQILNATRRTT